jgi:hypothetical protein
METVRQQIIDYLSNNAATAIDISRSLGIMEKEVYEHLPHIARSVATHGKRLVIHPSVCLKCGYAFEDRTRFTRPGRCPKCKETYIQRPSYEIR